MSTLALERRIQSYARQWHRRRSKIRQYSAKLNGKPLDRSWFRHTDIMNGGTLEFVMTDKPVRWDVGELPTQEF